MVRVKWTHFSIVYDIARLVSVRDAKHDDGKSRVQLNLTPSRLLLLPSGTTVTVEEEK